MAHVLDGLVASSLAGFVVLDFFTHFHDDAGALYNMSIILLGTAGMTVPTSWPAQVVPSSDIFGSFQSFSMK
jgi:hypothetical protein